MSHACAESAPRPDAREITMISLNSAFSGITKTGTEDLRIAITVVLPNTDLLSCPGIFSPPKAPVKNKQCVLLYALFLNFANLTIILKVLPESFQHVLNAL